MPFRFAALAVALLTPGFLFAHPGHEHHRPGAAVLDEDNWEEYVPHGKEVDAIYGDAVLYNRHITAVIANPVPTRNANMTVQSVGGCLIDLTVNGSSSDQLSCFYVGKRRYTYSGLGVFQGQDRKNGTTRSWAEVITNAKAGENAPAVELRYRIEGDNPYVTVATKFTNTGEKAITVPLQDDIRADGGKEDMPKSPNGTHDLYWIHDRYWGQAYGFEVLGGKVSSNSNSRTSSLTYVVEGKSSVTLEPGKSFTLTRRVYPGTNLLDVRAVHDQLRDRKLVDFTLTLRGHAKKPIAQATARLRAGSDRRGSGRMNEKGALQTKLPPGEYQVAATVLGVNLTGETSAKIVVEEGADKQAATITLPDWKPGNVKADITDAKGQPIPCKVEFLPKDGTPKPYFGPETAVFGVGNLRYTPDGTFSQQLPSGRYDVIVSHGPEYDAIFTELTIEPGKTASLTGTLERTVSTPGWVSSDFHSHSSPSGDNTGSQLGRVLNLVCEHIEFAPCTEHNRIETYVPEIKALGVEDRVTTVSGIELTGRPLPLNHQNAFPMVYKPRTQDGGAPLTDVDPTRQIERLFLWDGRSDKLIQQNHPDIGWLFYDRNGDGEPDGGFERSHDLIDVMEIHPIQHVLDLRPTVEYRGRPYGNRVFAWLQLLNQGYRIPGVVNTDAHYNFHGSGGLRNWIQSSTDEAGKISVEEMVETSKSGRLIMSNGPYLEFTLGENGEGKRVVAGQDLAAPSGKLTARVKVQCPNWLDVDRVFLLVNGRVHEAHDYRRKTHADLFGDGVVKFEKELELTVEGDAHVIAVAGGENVKLGPVMGPFWGSHEAAALTNPVFVDVDGGGFTPNKDTLGHPLPVKFGTRK